MADSLLNILHKAALIHEESYEQRHKRKKSAASSEIKQSAASKRKGNSSIKSEADSPGQSRIVTQEDFASTGRGSTLTQYNLTAEHNEREVIEYHGNSNDKNGMARFTARFSPSQNYRLYIEAEEITPDDVYCGQEHRGSAHPGNVAFRRIIEENGTKYKALGKSHGKKTKLSTFLLEGVIKGRFVKMDPVNGEYFLLTKEEARYKVSQALLDNKARDNPRPHSDPTGRSSSPPEEEIGAPLDRPPELPYVDQISDNLNPCVNHNMNVAATRYAVRFSPSEKQRIYISQNEITDDDILYGEEYRNSDNYGNVRFRHIVKTKQPMYRAFGFRDEKRTAMITTILEKDIFGRFVRTNHDGSFYLLTKIEAREIVSKALREEEPRFLPSQPPQVPYFLDHSVGDNLAPQIAQLMGASSLHAPINDHVGLSYVTDRMRSNEYNEIFTASMPVLRFSPSEDERIPISYNDITVDDIICGEGYRSRDNPGNVRFCIIVKAHQPIYRSFRYHHEKRTEMITSLLEEVIKGRFVRMHHDGKFYLLTKIEARTELSKALREEEPGDLFSHPPGARLNDPPIGPEQMRHHLNSSFDHGDKIAATKPATRFSPSEMEHIHISQDAITDDDIFCGQEYRGSTHPGNVRFRDIVKAKQAEYRSYGSHHGKKTEMSTTILEEDIKGRFIRMYPDGEFYLLTKQEARKKVSQALRDK